MSERRACLLMGQPRGTQRYRPIQREDEDRLTQAIIQLASQYGRYGYRRITALLQHAGWQVGKDRVERIWRREGLKVPKKQKPRGRLWLNAGSCVRLRPMHENHVWSYDFMSTRKTRANGLSVLGQKHCTSNPALPGRTATVNLSTASSGMSSSTEKSSTRSRSCVCWRNAGAFTTTRSDRTPRWVTDHRLRKRG